MGEKLKKLSGGFLHGSSTSTSTFACTSTPSSSSSALYGTSSPSSSSSSSSTAFPLPPPPRSTRPPPPRPTRPPPRSVPRSSAYPGGPRPAPTTPITPIHRRALMLPRAPTRAPRSEGPTHTVIDLSEIEEVCDNDNETMEEVVVLGD